MYFQDDFDAGYRPLVISSDDVTDISQSLNNNQKLLAANRIPAAANAMAAAAVAAAMVFEVSMVNTPSTLVCCQSSISVSRCL